MTETLLNQIETRDIPIPLDLPPIDGWKEIPIINFRTETKEDDLRDLVLAPLCLFSEYPTIYTDSIYGSERNSSPYQELELKDPRGLEAPLITMFVRPSVADGLIDAQAHLPSGHYLIVHDAYRPLSVQRALYDNYYQDLQKLHPEWTDQQLSEETQKYVSVPSGKLNNPSPHNTGGSIDLAVISINPDQDKRIKQIEETLASLALNDVLARYDLEMEMNTIKSHGNYLNFGTNFDYGGDEASLDYYERLAKQRTLNPEEQEALKNRRLLYHVMTDAGFEAYPFEWWHFNSQKSQMGSKTAGIKEAKFGPMTLTSENQQHEWLRQNLKIGKMPTEFGQDTRSLLQKLIPSRDLHRRARNLSQKVLKRDGSPIDTTVPAAEKISPKK